MSLELRPYQAEGASFLAERKRALLFDEMGVGKTPTTIAGAREAGAQDVVVICPKVVLGVWKNQIQNWWGEASAIIYAGQPWQRTVAWRRLEKASRPRFVIANYAQLPDLLERCRLWNTVIYDECHTIKNHRSVGYGHAKQLRTRNLFLLSGTPVSAGPQDLWSYLHLIDPGKFSSYWNFVKEHCVTMPNGFGSLAILRPKNPSYTRAVLKPYMLRRLKKDVLTELPDKTRTSVPVYMSPKQQEFYDALANDMIVTFGESGVLMAPTVLSQMTRLCQLTTTPQLLGIDCPSAALEATRDLAQAELDAGHNVVIFTRFRQAIPHIQSALAGTEARTFVLQGGMTQTAFDATVQAFDKAAGRKVLICTIQLGQGWDALTASAAIFLGFSFTPLHHTQSEDRLHRFGQRNPVVCYYIQTQGTLDQHILDILNQKTSWSNLILNLPKAVRPDHATPIAA